MIDILLMLVLFVIYVGFCLITINVYTQGKQITSIFVLPTFYLYYTILAAYVVNFVDVDGSVVVRSLETGIFAIGCGLLLIYFYKDKLHLEEGTSTKF